MLRWMLSLLLVISAVTVAGEQKAKNQLAPEWELYDAQNKLVSSSEFKGNPVILHFWATWCPYCKKLQPGLDDLYKKYQSQGLQMVAISFWEDEGANPQAVIEERGHSFKTLVNGDKVAKRFHVKGTPTTFFIDADGKIIAKTRISDPDDHRLEKVVKMMFRKGKEERSDKKDS